MTLFLGAPREATVASILFGLFGFSVFCALVGIWAFAVEMLMASTGLRSDETESRRAGAEGDCPAPEPQAAIDTPSVAAGRINSALRPHTLSSGAEAIRVLYSPAGHCATCGEASDFAPGIVSARYPQNTGALLRAACFGLAVDLIEPFGFVFDDRRLRRAVLDYAAQVEMHRHASWGALLAAGEPNSRLVLLTTRGTTPLHRFSFASTDTLLLRRESAGIPDFVHATAAA